MSVLKVYRGINNFIGPDYEGFGLGCQEMILIPNTYGSISMGEKPKRLSLIQRFCASIKK